jgi:hypothetical protein
MDERSYKCRKLLNYESFHAGRQIRGISESTGGRCYLKLRGRNLFIREPSRFDAFPIKLHGLCPQKLNTARPFATFSYETTAVGSHGSSGFQWATDTSMLLAPGDWKEGVRTRRVGYLPELAGDNPSSNAVTKIFRSPDLSCPRPDCQLVTSPLHVYASIHQTMKLPRKNPRAKILRLNTTEAKNTDSITCCHQEGIQGCCRKHKSGRTGSGRTCLRS